MSDDAIVLEMELVEAKERIAELEQELADWKADYDTLLKKLYEQEKTDLMLGRMLEDRVKHLARLQYELTMTQRHNELLRDVVKRDDVLIEFIDAWEMEAVPVPLFLKLGQCEEARQSAIDGGALDKDGEK